MRTSEQIDQIVTALAAARPHFETIGKNKRNPHFNSTYADLSAFIDAVYSPLAAQGLILTGGPEPHEDGGLLVSTRLIHISGQWLECVMRIPRSENMQTLGSGITYARRYNTAALLGIASEDDDDDGNSADQSSKAKPRRQSFVRHPDSIPPTTDQHPTFDQIQGLADLASSASTRDEFHQRIRRIFHLSGDTKLTRPVWRDQILPRMTMEQYEAIWADYQEMIRRDVEDDVTDHPDPQATQEPVDALINDSPEGDAVVLDPEAEAHVEAIRAELHEAAPRNAEYATVDQIRDLRAEALKVSARTEQEVVSDLQRHGGRFKLDLYRTMRNRILDQQAERNGGLEVEA